MLLIATLSLLSFRFTLQLASPCSVSVIAACNEMQYLCNIV